ncbi:MAG: replicative DNA helicase, partial [Phycisphaerae bacterium]
VDDPQDVVDRAEQTVFAVARRASGGREPADMNLVMGEISHLLDRDREQDGLPSGYRDLDALSGGFHGGELVIVAARPSMGKTALLLNMAERLALEDVPVAVFSLEMSRQQVGQRLWCSYGRFDLRRLRQNMMSGAERRTLEKARQRLRGVPIYIDDDAGLTVAQLRARARRLKAAHDVQAVLVDYLQLLQPTDERANRTVQVGQMSWGLKALAKELDVPVIAAAQLNRRVTDRSDFRPRMSDLRESGSIEQDADLVALLHREDYYHRGEPDYQDSNVTELIVAKQRNGPTGVVRLSFLQDCTRFELASCPAGSFQ